MVQPFVMSLSSVSNIATGVCTRQLKKLPVRLPFDIVANSYAEHPEAWADAANTLHAETWTNHALAQECIRKGYLAKCSAMLLFSFDVQLQFVLQSNKFA